MINVIKTRIIALLRVHIPIIAVDKVAAHFLYLDMVEVDIGIGHHRLATYLRRLYWGQLGHEFIDGYGKLGEVRGFTRLSAVTERMP